MTTPKPPCRTCYGTGEVVAESGPETCPDCFGEGLALGRGTKLEWRLRAIESTYERSPERETASDVLWLVGELRHARDALMRILTRCQDQRDSEPLARDVQHDANRGLGLYEVEDDVVRGQKPRA